MDYLSVQNELQHDDEDEWCNLLKDIEIQISHLERTTHFRNNFSAGTLKIGKPNYYIKSFYSKTIKESKRGQISCCLYLRGREFDILQTQRWHLLQIVHFSKLFFGKCRHVKKTISSMCTLHLPVTSSKVCQDKCNFCFYSFADYFESAYSNHVCKYT